MFLFLLENVPSRAISPGWVSGRSERMLYPRRRKGLLAGLGTLAWGCRTRWAPEGQVAPGCRGSMNGPGVQPTCTWASCAQRTLSQQKVLMTVPRV